MRHATFGCLTVFALAASSAPASEQDDYEQKYLDRAAESAVEATRTERAQWERALEAAFPGKVPAGRSTTERAVWFSLLSGNGETWRRAASPTPKIAELFDRVTERRRLGPVTSITRAEFDSYARRELRDRYRENREEVADEYAERVFRVLDRNGDETLEVREFTSALLLDWSLSDADSNGRLSKAEYRSFFRRTVAARTKTIAARPDPRNPAGASEDDEPALPDWFAALDADGDEQVSLFEWRTDGRLVAAYAEMDLDDDGLLTAEEYRRYVRRAEIEEAQRLREEQSRPE